MKFDVISLGEILCRLSPLGNERLSRCSEFQRQIGGAEFNVVSALSNVGIRSSIITKIPDNSLGVFVKNSLRSYGVSDDLLVYDDSASPRIGVYYSEKCSYPRKPCVIYDRENSSFSNLKLEDIPYKAFSSSKIFHTTGITLALGKELRENTIEIIKQFKENGTLISFDVNFRQNLWSEELARKKAGDVIRATRASKKAPGAERIYTAGEKEWLVWQQRKDVGVPINESVQQEMINVRDELGLTQYVFPWEK